MTAPNLTPADVALLDQVHAEANADLEQLMRHVRELVDQHGAAVGAAILTAELQTDPDPAYLAATAGVAITRLAQQEV